MNLDCASCPVRERAACAALSEQERTALARRAGRMRILKRGETLFAAGDDSDACATLIEGALKVASTDEDGTEHILALIHPAGFVGELFQPFAQHDLVALTDSRLCVFARSEMEDALRRHPALARVLLRRSQEDLHESRKLMVLSARRGASGKVAALLVELAQAASQSSCHPVASFDLPLTRGEIAALLGLTIETVSRSLTALEDDGLIRRKGARGIELLDLARLEEKAGALRRRDQPAVTWSAMRWRVSFHARKPNALARINLSSGRGRNGPRRAARSSSIPRRASRASRTTHRS